MHVHIGAGKLGLGLITPSLIKTDDCQGGGALAFRVLGFWGFGVLGVLGFWGFWGFGGFGVLGF